MPQQYLEIAAKLAVGFICLLIYLNLAGRGQHSPSSAADQVSGYVLGGIIGGMIYNTQVGIMELIVTIALWAAMSLATRFVKGRSRRVQMLIDGRSVLVFAGGQMLTGHMLHAGLTSHDFIADMHQRGIHSLDELGEVWLETNGQYTILHTGETPFALALVEDGQYVSENLKRKDSCSREWLDEQLQAQGIENISEVAYAEWNPSIENGVLRVYKYQ